MTDSEKTTVPLTRARFYVIRIRGRVDAQWMTQFAEFDISYSGDETCLYGEVKDQAALYGLLRRFRDLGVTLIEIRQVKE